MDNRAGRGRKGSQQEGEGDVVRTYKEVETKQSKESKEGLRPDLGGLSAWLEEGT